MVFYGVNPLSQLQDEMAHLPHNPICESPDKFDSSICAIYRKNVDILAARDGASQATMDDAVIKAKVKTHRYANKDKSVCCKLVSMWTPNFQRID